ncbi:DUF7527 domain-containing protein [Halobellus salinisoli]|uniref:DUF7527 domain-containing protein n=1 Tax=Halobellus salinisoli TaxID=3108500 RepID=UPI00300A2FDE
MNSRTIDVVTDWETVATPDGYEGLHELADAEFSGAVSAGMTWAFFLNGRVVGVFEGDIGDFEDAELTAYRAADPSLPLLFSMQERGGETQARYYTNETSLTDADQTLSNGGFTGYIELSENVLSGDYYVVYHGGKSMSAAFVGSSERLITGDEAFETAADEVGIYEVIDTDVELVEIPALPDPEPDDGDESDAADETDSTDDGTDSTDEADTDTAAVAADTADDGPEDAGADDGANVERGDSGPDEDDKSKAGGRANDDDRADADDSGSDEDAADGSRSDEDVESEPTETAGADDDAENAATSPAAGDGDAVGSGADPVATEPPSSGGETADEPSGGADGVFSDEERWRKAKTIPSLDPSESSNNGTAQRADESAAQSATERVAQLQKQQAARRQARDRGTSADSAQSRETQRDRSGRRGNDDTGRLKKRLSRARDRIDELESERETLKEERASLREEREETQQRLTALETERDDQRDRIEELEAERETLKAEVERLKSELDGESESVGDTSMSPERALSGTNLFVRYDRKGEATLEHAHAGEASREDVSKNLRLEHHTTFETDGLAVGGRPYAEFLRDSTEYSFAEWLVTDLLYEIGETGNRTGMAGVFDAIPEIDRIELYGTVGVDTEDGVERRDFDVIFRDKMGDPLFVADINDSRNATTEAMVGSLVTNTGIIAENDESLSAGFYVTESFYEPGALETVSEETGGGLLSRSKKRSFVKLSRKRGYHLCLVEARNGEFHLNVPDL